MDFAKRQMRNMGWSEGKGLGANESGIVKPITPNIQMDTRGLGFTITDSLQIKNQWWAEAYNVANKGLKPEYKITSVGVVVKTKDLNDTENDLKYNQHFISGGTILNDHNNDKSEEIIDDNNTCDNNDKQSKKKHKKKSQKHTIENETNDEQQQQQPPQQSINKKQLDFNEIFSKNKNITCHKAARLGIKMSGKMKRLQEQEANFIESNDLNLKKFKNKINS